jgi:hypothetical protein
MGPHQVAPQGDQWATVPTVSGLVSGESAVAGRPPLVIADATYPGVFRVRLADGTTSDMMNHARAVDTARQWAVTPPVRRKPSRASSPPPPVDVPTAPPSYVVVITVPPSNGADGRACSSRGPLFDVEVGRRVVVERSTTPFLDGARRLVELGHDGKAVLVMRHPGGDAVALGANLAAAAGLTVDEYSTPPFKRWKPWGGDAVHASNDIAQPGSSQSALAAPRPRRARARAEIDAIDREADSGWLRASLRARRSRLAKLIDPLDQMLDQAGQGDRGEVRDG